MEKTLTGTDEDIFAGESPPGKRGYFWREHLGKSYTMICGAFIVFLAAAVIIFIAVKGAALFIGRDSVPLFQFLFGTHFRPDALPEEGGASFGALVFLLGSVFVSTLAVLFSAPLSICSAILIAEVSPVLGEKLIRPSLELFAGIPSVVYGWVGLSVLVPFIRNHIGGLGFSLLAGGTVLALMILPTITTLSIDALRDVPRDYKEGSYALGATRWQTIRHIFLPVSKARLGVAVTLGLARAFGEALAVQMVIGNSARIPKSLLDSMCTLTSIITLDMGNTITGSAWNNALWSMALLLLLVTFGFILIVRRLGSQAGVKGVAR